MPKHRTIFSEDDLNDYRHDWDYSNHEIEVSPSAPQRPVVSRSHPKPMAVHLPMEILVLILDHCSPVTIWTITSLVCRQWYHASKANLGSACVWRYGKSDDQQFLQTMRISRRLMLQLAHIKPAGQYSWRRFLDAILKPPEDGPDPYLNIQVLVCTSDGYFVDPLGSLLSRLRFLRRLVLHDFHLVLTLSALFEHCSFLQDLSIHSFKEIAVSGPSPNSSHTRLNAFAYTGPVSVSVILWLLQCCPGLQRLNLNLVGQSNLKSIYTTASKYCHKLREMMISEKVGYTNRPANRDPVWVLHQEHTPRLTSMALSRNDFQHSPRESRDKWEPDRVARKVFHGLTHLSVPNGEVLCEKELDLILRCTPALISLNAPRTSFQWMFTLRGELSWYDIERITNRKLKQRNKEKARQRRLDTRRGTEDYPIKNDWQCNALRTLSIQAPYRDYYLRARRKDNVGFFYKYLVDHCPKMTWLTLNYHCLDIGQRLLPHLSYPFISDYPRRFGPKDSIKTSKHRASNDLHLLRGLENLFSLTLSAVSIPGVPVAEDLSFLRRPSAQTRPSDRTMDEGYESPIWPRLASFKVLYKDSPQVHHRSVFNSLVVDLRDMRPEVHFEITQI